MSAGTGPNITVGAGASVGVSETAPIRNDLIALGDPAFSEVVRAKVNAGSVVIPKGKLLVWYDPSALANPDNIKSLGKPRVVSKVTTATTVTTAVTDIPVELTEEAVVANDVVRYYDKFEHINGVVSVNPENSRTINQINNLDDWTFISKIPGLVDSKINIGGLQVIQGDVGQEILRKYHIGGIRKLLFFEVIKRNGMQIWACGFSGGDMSLSAPNSAGIINSALTIEVSGKAATQFTTYLTSYNSLSSGAGIPDDGPGVGIAPVTVALALTGAGAVTIDGDLFDGNTLAVDYDGGTNTATLQDGTQLAHTYTAYTGDATFTGEVVNLSKLVLTGEWSFDIAVLNEFINLDEVMFDTGVLVTGDIKDIPPGLSIFNVHGDNVLTGDIKDIPDWVTLFSVWGNNTLTGDIADMDPSVTYLSVVGSNTLTGDIKDLSSSVTYFRVLGSNTLTGDIADLSSSVTLFRVYGNNTFTGDIKDLSSSVTLLDVQGSNTLTGDIADLSSSVTLLRVFGSNTLTGDIADLSSSVTYLSVGGNNTLTYTTGLAPTRTWERFQVTSTGGTGLTSAEVDQLLIDLAAATWTGTVLTITGNAAAPTAASAAAITTLGTKGVVVSTN